MEMLKSPAELGEEFMTSVSDTVWLKEPLVPVIVKG